MARLHKSAKATAAKSKTLTTAVDSLIAQYSPVLEVWNQATPDQKQKFLEHSPILAKLLNWSRQWQQ